MMRKGLILVAAAAAVLLVGAAHAQGPDAFTAKTQLPAGVTIAGVQVGGLPPARAYAAVRAAFQVPVSLVLRDKLVLVSPAKLGAVGYAKRAVWAAQAAKPGAKVQLPVDVRQGPLRTYLTGLGAGLKRAPLDAQLNLRGLKPVVRPDRPGLRLDRAALAQSITNALVAGSREPIFVPTVAVPAAVTTAAVQGPVVVIHRGRNVLDLYHGEQLVRAFPVATGQAIYPTPLGRFSIVVRWKNPWWYPPNDAWAAGEKPTPPGPGNPLGTRWMGLSSPGVGIHGTNNESSIGYSVSHGCIRMHVSDSEWLFDHVEVGTTVFIVAT